MRTESSFEVVCHLNYARGNGLDERLSGKNHLVTPKDWDKREFAKTLLLIPGGHPNGYKQKAA